LFDIGRNDNFIEPCCENIGAGAGYAEVYYFLAEAWAGKKQDKKHQNWH
jgi:hypothetical protein